jgi:pantoate--beta-alanine ligase
VTFVVNGRADFFEARGDLAGPVGLVATMGALHAGHAALMDAARATNESVVATIFVNPLQFGPNEDLSRYPRTLDADLDLCREHGVDLVWAPAVEDVYAAGPVQVTLAAGPLGDILEGASRPGHFAGMLTVVAKLLSLVRPDRAYFGEKDYQQLTLVRRLVADLDLGPEIIGVPTVREPDGLARSSRNVYLSAAEHQQALALSQALLAAAAMKGGGGDAVLTAAREVLAEAAIEPDYLELRAPDLGPAPVSGLARLLIAARVGSPRLIDNIEVML